MTLGDLILLFIVLLLVGGFISSVRDELEKTFHLRARRLGRQAIEDAIRQSADEAWMAKRDVAGLAPIGPASMRSPPAASTTAGQEQHFGSLAARLYRRGQP